MRRHFLKIFLYNSLFAESGTDKWWSMDRNIELDDSIVLNAWKPWLLPGFGPKIFTMPKNRTTPS